MVKIMATRRHARKHNPDPEAIDHLPPSGKLAFAAI
jgi:hypothetical protein